jgi:hypothetical protein
MLSGLRPDSLAHYGFEKGSAEGRTEMHHWFYKHGYNVAVVGKVNTYGERRDSRAYPAYCV